MWHFFKVITELLQLFKGAGRQHYSYLCQSPVIPFLLSYLPACLIAAGIATFPYPAVTAWGLQQAPFPSVSITVGEELKKPAE